MRLLAVVVAIALSTGCTPKHPRATAIAGTVLVASAVASLATTPSCNDASAADDHDDDGGFVPGLGAGLSAAGCAVGQAIHLSLAVALGVPGAVGLGLGLAHFDDERPPATYRAAPGVVAIAPGVPLRTVADAPPAAVQLARTAWFSARLGRCAAARSALARVQLASPAYYQLAIAPNPTFDACRAN